MEGGEEGEEEGARQNVSACYLRREVRTLCINSLFCFSLPYIYFLIFHSFLLLCLSSPHPVTNFSTVRLFLIILLFFLLFPPLPAHRYKAPPSPLPDLRTVSETEAIFEEILSTIHSASRYGNHKFYKLVFSTLHYLYIGSLVPLKSLI